MPRALLGALAVIAVCAASGAAAASQGPLFLVTATLLPRYDAQVEVLDSRGRVVRIVARPRLSQSFGASWSPDGSKLAWVGPDGVSVEPADSAKGKRLLVRAGFCSQVCVPLSMAWSPDSRQLLVGGVGNQTAGFVSVSVESGRIVSLARPRAFTEYRAIGWSRDEIVYSRFSGDPGTASCCQLSVFVARPDGSRPKRLFSFADGGIHDGPNASLSPDGRSLAFTSEARDPRDPRLAIIDLGRGISHSIKRIYPLATAPAWSPDSHSLAVATRHNLVIFTADGANRHSIPTDGGLLDWSNRGALTIVRGEQSNEIFQSSTDSHSTRLLFRMPKKQSIMAIAVKYPAPRASRAVASAVVLRDFLLKPSGILLGMHPTEARIIVTAVAAAPLKVCQLGTTFSTHWRGGCRRLAGRPLALPTSGGAVHIGVRLVPANGRATQVVALRVRWHCVDHYFALLRGKTVARGATPVFDC